MMSDERGGGRANSGEEYAPRYVLGRFDASNRGMFDRYLGAIRARACFAASRVRVRGI